MKNAFLLVALLLGMQPRAQAAFRMKMRSAGTEHVILVSPQNNALPHQVKEKLAHAAFYRIAQPLLPKKRKEGWEGEAALICGILGLVTVLPAIPAIILGYIGLEKKKNRGAAFAGVVLGYVVLGAVVSAILAVMALLMILGNVSLSVM